MKNRILITVLMVVVCYGIGQAQQCPIGCQDEDRRLAKPSGSPAKSNLSSAIPSEIHPDPNPAKHFAESVRGAGASQLRECSSGPRHGGSHDAASAKPASRCPSSNDQKSSEPSCPDHRVANL